jgi:hypothetical protein
VQARGKLGIDGAVGPCRLLQRLFAFLSCAVCRSSRRLIKSR